MFSGPGGSKNHSKIGPESLLALELAPRASWRPLGPLKAMGCAELGHGGGHAAATPGLSGRIRMYVSLVYPEEKEVRKDKSRKGR